MSVKNAEDLPWRLFDYDQTHVLSTVLVWTPFTGFELGTRFRLASGYPCSAVTGTYYDARRDRTQPLFGEQNGTRIPLFLQSTCAPARRSNWVTASYRSISRCRT